MALSLQDMIGNQAANTARSLRRGGAVVAAMTLTCALLSAALGCAIAALWLAVSPVYGPVMAALAAAGVLLVLAGVSLLWVQRFRGHRVGYAVAPGLGGVSQAFRADKASWLTAALVAGLMAGGRKF